MSTDSAGSSRPRIVRTITREIASGRTQLRTQHRRQAVAAGHNEAEVSDQFNFKRFPKTAGETDAITKGLMTSALFRNLEDALMEDIISALEPIEMKKGTQVIQQSEQGDYFYVIKDGSFEVTKSAGKGESITLMGVLTAPAIFGELALFYSSPRAATVTAKTVGQVWRVERTVFRGVLFRSAHAAALRFLREVPVLSRLSEMHLTKISGLLTGEKLEEGAQPSKGRFHIVREGNIDFTYSSKKEGYEDKPVVSGMRGAQSGSRSLEKFSFFGNREILCGEEGITFRVAKGGCTLMSMSKQDFMSIYEFLESQLNDLLKYNALRAIPLLKDVKDSQLTSVLDRFETFTAPAGEVIIKRETIGKRFFILTQGHVEVIVGGKQVATLAAHNFFGERSLLKDDPTMADVVATTDVQGVCLDRRAFDVMLGPLKEIIARESRIVMIKKVKLLQLLSEREVEELASACSLVAYAVGDTIIKQGEYGETFYMLKSGEVAVSRDNVEVVRLKQGSFFGERALLEDEPRGATITATSETECYVIDRLDFNRHLGSLEDIMKMHTNKLERVKAERLIQLQDLRELALLGSGAFGLVSLVKDLKHTQRTFALKAINKKYVQQMKMQLGLRREVTMLGQVDHPMLMRLVKTFKDASRVYMLMEPLMGGELFVHLSVEQVFKEERAKFYAACVILGLNHLHCKGIIYRDLKLENLLLDSSGYLKIVDFGFAKKLTGEELAYTLCGTPDYLAPEIIKGVGHDKGCDIWSLGVLIFEMLHGYTPFGADDDSQIFTQILSADVHFESHCPDLARSLIKSMLNRNPKARIGNGKFGMKPIMSHPWFKSIDWEKLEAKKIKPPFVPTINGEDDVTNFDEVDDEMHNNMCKPVDDKMLDAVFSNAF